MRFPQLTGPRRDADLEAKLEALERRLAALEELLEKRNDQLELEWSEWFDKFRRLYARLAKRVERSQNDDQQSDRGGDAPPPAPGVTNPLALAILRGGRA